ncbi:MAG: TraB/GumN family protein [Flavobacteriales bacterium]|nr:TraB/GumN family protein [Flavobacteriales bacterium]
MRSLTALVLLLHLAAFGQLPQKGLLWRAASPDGVERGFVFGTVHSQDARAYAHVPQALAAMARAEAVFGELDIRAARADSARLVASMMLPPGKSLRDYYSPRAYTRLQKALKEEFGPLTLFVGKLKPFYLMAILSQEGMRKDSAETLDVYLLERAASMGKRTGGVETMAEQMAAVDAVPLQEQADLLLEAVKRSHHQTEMDRMMDDYVRQDLLALQRMLADGPATSAFDHAMVRDRNRVMVQRMDSLMGLAPSFFAVGAAHLPGEDGVLRLLAERGYVLSPVFE